MPSEGHLFPYVLLFRERQTVVLERHPDPIGGPARSASTKPIFAVAPPVAILPFFMRGGALQAHDPLVAKSLSVLEIFRIYAQNEVRFCIRHQYHIKCACLLR